MSKIPFKINSKDYKNFVNFLNGVSKGDREFINPLNFFLLREDLVSKNFLSENYISSFFNGSKVDLPSFKVLDKELQKFNRFEDYTAVNEVDHISAWTLSFFDYFIKILNINNGKVGKELEILQSANPRDGRIDVLVQINNEIIFWEAKTTLKSALAENRFTYQISSYYEEGNKDIKLKELNYSFDGFLILGGEETDVYPFGHHDCTTGLIGDSSKIFYSKLEKNNIKFASVNFLWTLLNYSLVKRVKVDIFRLIREESNKKGFVGFLSGGSVINGAVEPIVIDDYISS